MLGKCIRDSAGLRWGPQAMGPARAETAVHRADPRKQSGVMRLQDCPCPCLLLTPILGKPACLSTGRSGSRLRDARQPISHSGAHRLGWQWLTVRIRHHSTFPPPTHGGKRTPPHTEFCRAETQLIIIPHQWPAWATVQDGSQSLSEHPPAALWGTGSLLHVSG